MHDRSRKIESLYQEAHQNLGEHLISTQALYNWLPQTEFFAHYIVNSDSDFPIIYARRDTPNNAYALYYDKENQNFRLYQFDSSRGGGYKTREIELKVSNSNFEFCFGDDDMGMLLSYMHNKIKMK